MIIQGDCKVLLAAFPEASIDAVVTDPPYGLSKEPNAEEMLRHWLAGDDYTHGGGGFMGKTWDSFVPGPATWREAFRVLKPGGYALVFAGSRTQDLMSLALRLAGFEIRDVAMWIYGSGFPKSLDVSKAIDASDATKIRRERALKFTAWMRSTGITAAQINEATGSAMGSHYLTDATQPAVATLDMFEKMCQLLPEPPADILELMQWRTVESENMKRRDVLGVDIKARSSSGSSALPTMGGETVYKSWDITTAHTEEAKQWEGWGTALKPAYEPIIIARKPLIGTVADNVLTHGTGAINIDGCRIPSEKQTGWGGDVGFNNTHGQFATENQVPRPVDGRWPANIMHDGSPEVVDPLGDTARFFYCAKTSKADRNAGCDHLDAVTAGEATGGRAEGSDGRMSPRAGAGRTSGAKNHHPTVKPTDLMRYCCRLVTPPGGLILDPFTGSGSTGRGAILEGFNFIGIERDPEYVEIARARIEEARR